MRNMLRFLVRLLIDLVARVEVRGVENVPQDSAFVIASNHLGFIDTFMVYYALDRWDLFVLIGEKWGRIPFFRWVGKYFNFVFIDRFNPDLKALRDVILRMRAGQVLVIAPEGTRSHTGSLIEGKPGVSYLAAKLGYPIVPAAVTGTPDRIILDDLRHLRRARVTVTAGPVFHLPPLPVKEREQALQEDTDEIMCRIAALLPEELRGVYRGHPKLKDLLTAGG
jgi:1-acyl-sn-glycerol-3-phosphate acyltransferase